MIWLLSLRPAKSFLQPILRAGINLSAPGTDVTVGGFVAGFYGLRAHHSTGLSTIVTVSAGGEIVGNTEAAVLVGSDASILLRNYGTISGAFDGVEFEDNASGSVLNYGIINGSFRAQFVDTDVSIFNFGSINGLVTTGGGNDTYFGNGDVNFQIVMQGGNDTMTIWDMETNLNSILSGGDGNDTISFENNSAAIWFDMDAGVTGRSLLWTRDSPTLADGVWRAVREIAEFENVTGTVFVDVMRGDAADNVFTYLGSALQTGIEQIDGRGGSDTVDFSEFSSAIWLDLEYDGSEVWTRDTVKRQFRR